MTTNFYAPLGFIPVRNKFNSGAGQMGQYTISSSDGAIFGLNDLLKISSGNTVTKAGPTDTPIGTFQGWNFRTRSPYGASYGGAADNAIVPWKKIWNGAITVNTNQYVEALVDDDPAATYRVQTFGSIAQTNIGALVDMTDCPGGPDVNVMGRGKQAVGTPTTYYNITSIAVNAAGSGYTQNGVDLVVNGQIMDIRPGDIVISGGALSSFALLNNIQGLASNSNTVTVQPKPGFAGSGGTVTPSYSGAQTAAQFRIERIFEQPFRSVDGNNNTAGYDLSVTGANAWVEVAYAKHKRLGSALYV